MPRRITRRKFVQTSALGLAAAGAGRAAAAAPGQSPTVIAPRSARPVVVASANGHQYKNGGPRTAVEEAFHRLVRGEDVLDAVLAGVNLCELDPEEDSVGYGGLPNADGVVQLDASCMHGSRRRAGAVAALEGVRTPSLVAKAVMDRTDHHLLVGRGAQEFARSLGFRVEEDLNTEHSRAQWLEWKRRLDPQHYLDPERRSAEAWRALRSMVADGLLRPDRLYGTINCNALSPRGELAGATTTSGLSWKIPGRVGDSAIFGAGLYVDGDVGAVGSTGRGEANLFHLSSFLVVERLRQGAHPKDAGLEALRRIQAATREPRLLTVDGQPDFNVRFYVVDRRGEYAGVSLYAETRSSWESGKTGTNPTTFAVCTENGAETRRCESLLGVQAASRPS